MLTFALLLWFFGGLGWVFYNEEREQAHLTLWGRFIVIVFWPGISAVAVLAAAHSWWMRSEERPEAGQQR